MAETTKLGKTANAAAAASGSVGMNDSVYQPYLGIRQTLVPNELYWVTFQDYRQATEEILRRKDMFVFSSNVHE